MVADKDVDLNDKIVQEIERKQHSPLKTQIFQEKKKDVFDFTYQSLEKYKDLYFQKWL